MRILLVVTFALALSTTAFTQSLSGSQIRQTLVGNTINGVEDGDTYIEYLSPDGTIVGRSQSGEYSGNWRISGNEICFSYPEGKRGGGKWDCNEVRLQGSQVIWDDNSTATLSSGTR